MTGRSAQQAFLTLAEGEDVCAVCRSNPRFVVASRLIDGVVRLSADAYGADFRFALGRGLESVERTETADPRSVPTAGDDRASADVLFGVHGTTSAWQVLFTGTATSLNRSVREGALELTGDRVAAMRSWLVLFILTEACRTVLMQNGGRRTEA